MDRTINFDNQLVFCTIKIGYIKCFPIESLNNKNWELTEKLFTVDIPFPYFLP